MVRKRDWQFFLAPNTFTNESIARELAKEGLAEESSWYIEYEGKTKHGWTVPHSLITSLEDGKMVFKFKFKVFSRPSEGSKWRLYKLYLRKKISRTKEMKEAREDLKKIQKARKNTA